MSHSSDEEIRPDDACAVDYDPSELPLSLDAGSMDHYLDVGPSSLRQDTLNDPKYSGARISRQQLSDEEEDEDEGSEEEDFDEEPPTSEADNFSMPKPSPTQKAPVKRSTPERSSQDKAKEEANSALRVVTTDDREKGKAVTHQIAMWDALLDARIRLQKVLTTTNALPSSSRYPKISEHETASQSLTAMIEEATALSRELSHLQQTISKLDSTFPPSDPPSLESDLDFEAQLSALSASESAREASQHQALVQTLSKWSTKIQAAQPSFLLPPKSSFKNAWNKQDDQRPPGVVQVIQDDLNGTEKLLSRTKIVRSGKARPATNSTPSASSATQEDGSPDVFDDTDFYQQLLRDVIDTRSGAAEESWMARQAERKAKKKANVDTKASKGRKLRYQVHEKIQHFMVPIPVVQGGWHEEQIDDLFLSLAKYDGDV